MASTHTPSRNSFASALRSRLLLVASASGVALSATACGARGESTEADFSDTWVTPAEDSAGSAGAGGEGGGASGSAGEAGSAGDAGSGGEGGSAGGAGSGGAAGSQGQNCEAWPSDKPIESVCSTAQPPGGWGYCQFVCYIPGEGGAPPGACLSGSSPELAALPAFQKTSCGLQSVLSDAYCDVSTPGSCCYVGLQTPCAGRPLLAGSTLVLAALRSTTRWC